MQSSRGKTSLLHQAIDPVHDPNGGHVVRKKLALQSSLPSVLIVPLCTKFGCMCGIGLGNARYEKKKQMTPF